MVDLFIFAGMIVINTGLIDLAEYISYVDAIMHVLLAGDVVVDPNTQGLSVSRQVLKYVKLIEK